MVNSKSRIITLLATLLFGTIVLIVSLAALGFSDPITTAEPLWQKELNSMLILPESSEVRWLTEDIPSSPISVRLTAGYEAGESDSSYGLLLGQENDAVAVMVSPLGYVAIRQQPSSVDSGTVNYYLPWQTWPHVQTADQKNELLVYLDGDTITVRVNREWLWEENEIEHIERIGIIGESYGEEVSIDFQLAELSAVESGK